MEILIAAQDKSVRSSLAFLIKYSGNKDNAHDAGDPVILLEKLRNYNIDLVIIEWGFFFEETFEMMPLLKKAYPETAFVATGLKKEYRRDAITAGTDDFYLKSESPEELIKIIDRFRKKIQPEKQVF